MSLHDATDPQPCYGAVRDALSAAVLPDSPLGRAVRIWLLDRPLPPGLLIPVAAAGALTPASVAVSSALGFLLLAMRWLDDLVDRDRDGQLWEDHGTGGAAVLSAAALSHGWGCLVRCASVPRDVLSEFADMTAVLALGEDADANAPPDTPAAWQRIAWRKTGVCYRFAARAGAHLSGDVAWHRHAPVFGAHLGLFLQAMDDIEGAFSPGAPDLARGTTMTLPLVLLSAHCSDTQALFRARQVDQLSRALARHDIRRAAETLAYGHSQQARAALLRCPGPWQTAGNGLLAALCGAEIPEQSRRA